MKNKMIIGLIGAFAVSIGLSQPALANSAVTYAGSGQQASGAARAEGETRGTRMTRQERGRSRAPSPEQVRAAAQTHLTAAGVTCSLTEAVNPGRIGTTDVYEVACDSAPGYILMASTPPQAFDCIELAGTAATARAADPAADVGMQCMLPANQNGLQVISAWAQQAGAACTIDQAQAVGKRGSDTVYEIGCANADGYWMQKVDGAFALTPCIKVTSQGSTCRFTTPEEIATSFQTKLAGTEAESCQVAQVRLMGGNENGEFYEAKCAAEGEGFIARLNAEGVTQQVYACASSAARVIGSGCTLTQVPAAPATGGRP
ncbi:hypothetical protein GCM10009422_29890 [Brevundimonas kwangchunensis]|uniref:Uncharacterized protein n=1 Tax=Brevundimonas kwangchunensis TaxID=322163 RepID=A0ABN1H6P1_9CAUL